MAAQTQEFCVLPSKGRLPVLQHRHHCLADHHPKQEKFTFRHRLSPSSCNRSLSLSSERAAWRHVTQAALISGQYRRMALTTYNLCSNDSSSCASCFVIVCRLMPATVSCSPSALPNDECQAHIVTGTRAARTPDVQHLLVQRSAEWWDPDARHRALLEDGNALRIGLLMPEILQGNGTPAR